MSSIENFIKHFLELEVETKNSEVKPDLEKFNNSVRAFNELILKDLLNNFGYSIPVRPLPQSMYVDFKDYIYKHPRHLFKISFYNNQKLGELWMAYTSGFISNDRQFRVKRMTHCFIISKVEGNFKVVGFASINPDGPARWVYDFGDPEFDIKNPGEFISATRYLEPSSDEISMEKWRREE